MRIRLKRGELAIIALTLMFACFIGGYFAGRRSAVNIVPVQSASNGNQPYRPGEASSTESSANSSNSAQNPGSSASDDGAAQNTITPAGTGSSASGDSSEPAGALRDNDGKIDINSASRSELMDLSGIGQVLAERIIDYRTQNGPFAIIDDLMKVSGIGEKRFAAIKDRITVG